ncbi:MAG TPA: hypothetical protein PKG76_10620 [Acidobacteriota bacterium]|nr:hypothetical protein [Acidobacteriota bacterium]
MRHVVIWFVLIVSTLSVAGQSLVGLSRKEKTRAAQNPATTIADQNVTASSPASLAGLSKKKSTASTKTGARVFTNKDLATASGSISQSKVPASVAQAAQPKGGPGKPRSVAPQSGSRAASPATNQMTPIGAAGVTLRRTG